MQIERGRKPINAKSETVATLPTFRDGYRLRRCILPVDGFSEWMATKGGKQRYAIAMRDGSPFGIAAAGYPMRSVSVRSCRSCVDGVSTVDHAIASNGATSS